MTRYPALACLTSGGAGAADVGFHRVHIQLGGPVILDVVHIAQFVRRCLLAPALGVQSIWEDCFMQTIDQTIASVPAMSISDRLRLAEAIWDSLNDENAPILTREQRAEFDRRMSDHDANPGSALTCEEVERRLAELR